MSERPSASEIDEPHFCPWCGAPAPYRRERHIPLWQRLADEIGKQPPEAMEDALHIDACVTGCPECRRVSHVIGHKPSPRA